jgi:hypothetical protein
MWPKRRYPGNTKLSGSHAFLFGDSSESIHQYDIVFHILESLLSVARAEAKSGQTRHTSSLNLTSDRRKSPSGMSSGFLI